MRTDDILANELPFKGTKRAFVKRKSETAEARKGHPYVGAPFGLCGLYASHSCVNASNSEGVGDT